jgi:Bacteriocin-protection, YdeI or OmpD-Associated/Domain of unknown function (DUF1905)
MTEIQRFESGMHYILVPTEIVESYVSKGSKRAICDISDQKFHCAFMPKKEGGFFINLGQSICKKLNLKLGMHVNPTFEEDKSEFQFEMPEEFAELLAQDPDADEVFLGLTNGNKRSLIYLISLVKSTDKKIERGLLIAQKLKLGVTQARLILKK